MCQVSWGTLSIQQVEEETCYSCHRANPHDPASSERLGGLSKVTVKSNHRLRILTKSV
jgi:hypothetical protein